MCCRYRLVFLFFFKGNEIPRSLSFMFMWMVKEEEKTMVVVECWSVVERRKKDKRFI